jgi:regulator of sigma D
MTTADQQPASERRARTRKEIKQLIKERNTVLSQYYNLASQADEIESKYDLIVDQLQEFCQELVDYLATGHFEIYRRLEEGEERRDDMIGLAGEIYTAITNTTQAAIDFNDMYDLSEGIDTMMMDELPRHLSTLGVQLATRIELEDKFIDTLLSKHNPDKPQLHAI